jgi:hypothetical protein
MSGAIRPVLFRRLIRKFGRRDAERQLRWLNRELSPLAGRNRPSLTGLLSRLLRDEPLAYVIGELHTHEFDGSLMMALSHRKPTVWLFKSASGPAGAHSKTRNGRVDLRAPQSTAFAGTLSSEGLANFGPLHGKWMHTSPALQGMAGSTVKRGFGVWGGHWRGGNCSRQMERFTDVRKCNEQRTVVPSNQV